MDILSFDPVGPDGVFCYRDPSGWLITLRPLPAGGWGYTLNNPHGVVVVWTAQPEVPGFPTMYQALADAGQHLLTRANWTFWRYWTQSQPGRGWLNTERRAALLEILGAIVLARRAISTATSSVGV